MTSWPIVEAVSTGNLVALLLILWRANVAVGEMQRIVRDFPPHRHVGDDIIYPAGYVPEDPHPMRRKGDK